MKATITLEISSGEHPRLMGRLLEVLGRGDSRPVVETPPVSEAEIVGAAAAQETMSAEQHVSTGAAVPPRTRKPRSDAGQPRGPHKSLSESAEAVSDLNGPSAKGPAASASVAEPAPTQSTPLAPTPLAAPPSAAATTAPAGAGAVKLTEAHARAELKKISTEPGMGGTQAAIDYIKKFGVHQITKLPESMYEQFIRGVDQEIAAFRAKPKAPAAK